MNNQSNKFMQNNIEKTNQPLLTMLKKDKNSLKVNKTFNNRKQITKQLDNLYNLKVNKFEKFISPQDQFNKIGVRP